MDDERARTVGLMTVGCKLNQYETEGLAELLESEGYEVVPFGERADVYVVNTCTVTGRSDYRCRQMLRRAARTNPGALVVAAGCYAQRDPGALAAMPEVGLVVGQSSKSDLPDLIERARRRGSVPGGAKAESRPGAGDDEAGEEEANADALVDVRPHDGRRFDAFDIERFRGYTRAFLKIQDGCDGRCAYCAVPSARGPARSRPAADVVEQARRLVANGYRELVLTGVHIGTFRDGLGLAGLLAELSGLDGLARLRLGSLEPTELREPLAAEIVTNDRVAPHVHVPMQSGSDTVLAAMRRDYSSAEYEEAVRRVTDRSSETGLGADVIVGFPGETDEDFADTVSLVERLPITYLHVFSFSPRLGTEAAEMDDSVPGTEKKRRSRVLRALGRAKSRAFRDGLIGTTQQVLVESGSNARSGRLSGLSGNYVRVEVGTDSRLCNRLVSVRVDGADDSRTWGEVLRELPTDRSDRIEGPCGETGGGSETAAGGPRKE